MQKNYNENLVAGAAIRDDKGRRISKLFESPHPKMTVGYAKNLIMPYTPTEQEFNFRQSGGGLIEDGVAVIDKVKGKSVVWNQLINNVADTTGQNGWWNRDGKSLTIDGNKIEQVITDANVISQISQNVGFKIYHKYLVTFEVNVVSDLENIFIDIIQSSNRYGNTQQRIGSITHKEARFATIYTALADMPFFSCYHNKKLNEGDKTIYDGIKVIDLTQMFGDGNEPSTVEEFLQRKPKVADEYAYNEGTIVNNKVEKVVTTGRNLWDEEWELGTIAWSGVEAVSNTRIRSSFVPIFANKTYYLRCGSVRYEVFFYDANKSLISYSTSSVSNGTFTTPNGAVYLRFTTNSNYTETTYNHDICVNLSEPTINGQYFPYEKHELDLSWVKDIKDTEGVKLFEDGMRSAGTAYDEAGAKKAVKRIGVVDLGSLDISKFNTNTPPSEETKGVARFFVVIDDIMQRENFANQIVQVGYTGTRNVSASSIVDGTFFTYTNKRVFYHLKCDASNYNKEWFKEQMQGQYLVYELAEPIEVEYGEKNLTYPVVASGTEEAIANEPSSAFRADIGYGIDAVKTILDLKARVKALEEK